METTSRAWALVQARVRAGVQCGEGAVVRASAKWEAAGWAETRGRIQNLLQGHFIPARGAAQGHAPFPEERGSLSLARMPGIYANHTCQAYMPGIPANMPSTFAWHICLAYAWHVCLHICQAYMPSIHARHICQAHLPGMYARHICLAFMPGIHAWHICLAYLLGK